MAISGCWSESNIHVNILKGIICRISYPETSCIEIEIPDYVLREPVEIKAADRYIMIPVRRDTSRTKEHD